MPPHPLLSRSLLACIAGVLTACATPEYRAAQSQCAPSAFTQFPIQQVSTWVTLHRVIQVPTGQSHCTTTQQGQVAHTVCNPVTRPEFIPYQQMVMTDANESARNAVIQSCANQLCLQRYGNPDCKLPASR
jgi:hypothetical protein